MALSPPIDDSMVLMTESRVKGSLIKFDIDSSGKNCVMFDAMSLFGKMVNVSNPFMIPSAIFQTNRNPKAKADRLTKIPRKRQNEKNAVSFRKYANRYSRSEKTIESSVYEEKL